MTTKRDQNIYQRSFVCNDQYLYTEGIYALNRLLDEIQDELANEGFPSMDESSLVIVPTLFNKKNRTFHNATVLGQAWGPDLKGPELKKDKQDKKFNENFLVKEVVSFIKNWKGGDSDIQKISDNLMDGRAYKEALDQFRSYLKSVANVDAREGYSKCAEKMDLLFTNDDKTPDDILSNQRKLVRTLHLLYHGYKNHRYLYIPGILYQGVDKYSKEGRVEYFQGNAKDIITKKDNTGKELQIPRAYEGCFYNRSGVFAGKEKFNQLSAVFKSNGFNLEVSHGIESEYRGTEILFDLVNILYMNQLNADDNRKDWWSTGPILILPIFDVWLGGKGYGGIWGCLTFTFKNIDTLNVFKPMTLGEFKPRCDAISDSLFQTGLATILVEEIIPPYDLVEHFVRMIIHVQDWNRITVHRVVDGKEKKRLYCYKRIHEDTNEHSPDFDWSLCKDKSCDTCCEDNDRRLSWSELDINVWSTEIIPELSEEEKQQFQDITIDFFYPDSSYLPPESKTEENAERDYFNNAVILQQTDVLATLIPKVRARRSALRNAIVSIMGRNMSHNIGSHVLARLQIASSVDVGDIRKPEHDAGKLVRFLQQRMDFIAEVSTTNPFFSLPMNLFGDVLREFGDQKLILKHISGIGALEAVIKIWDEELGAIDLIKQSEVLKKLDIRFSSTGGRAGMHALYVFIENFIRNSAKHGSGQESWTQIKKEIKEEDSCAIYTIAIPKQVCPNSMLFKHEDIAEVEVNVSGKKIFYKEYYEEAKEDIISLPELDKAITENVAEAQIILKSSLGLHPLRLSLTGTEPGKLEIYLGIRDTETSKYGDRYHEILIWDRHRNGTISEKKKNSEESTGKESTADRINRILQKSSLVNQDGTLNQEAWGIREMQIACAYLRGMSLEELEARLENDPPILEACLVNDKGQENKKDSYNLAYRFYLKKAQDLLIVADKENEIFSAVTGLANIEYVFKGNLSQKNKMDQEYCLWVASEEPTKEEKSKLPARFFKLGEVTEDICKRIEKGQDIVKPMARYWFESLSDEFTLRYDFESVYTYAKSLSADKWYSRNDIEENILSSGQHHLLVFDEHGYMLTLQQDNHAKEWSENSSYERMTLLEKIGFYEPIRSNFPQTPFLQEEDKGKAEIYNYLFKAAALSRVLILDERIQAAVEKESEFFSPFLRIDLLRLGRVFVPSKTDCDLDNATLDPSEIDTWLEQFNNTERLNITYERFDFIVIHQGIVDKLRKSKSEIDGPDGWIETLLKKRSHSGRLVICSGRGAPRDLPFNARFLPLSGLLHTVTMQPSKFHLMHLLWASRAPGK